MLHGEKARPRYICEMLVVCCAGYEAWRHAKLGSWFIRTLVYVFQRRAHRQNVLEMLTEVTIAHWLFAAIAFLVFSFFIESPEFFLAFPGFWKFLVLKTKA